MSYGVLVSKTGQVWVETLEVDGGDHPDAVLDRFRAEWGAMWVPGRLTLTRLHLTFVPREAGRGMAMTDLDLREVTAVELHGGRIGKMISLRTRRHVTRIRCLGASAMARQIAGLLDGGDREPAAPQP